MPKSDSRKSESRKFAVAKRSLNTEWGLKAPHPVASGCGGGHHAGGTQAFSPHSVFNDLRGISNFNNFNFCRL